MLNFCACFFKVFLTLNCLFLNVLWNIIPFLNQSFNFLISVNVNIFQQTFFQTSFVCLIFPIRLDVFSDQIQLIPCAAVRSLNFIARSIQCFLDASIAEVNGGLGGDVWLEPVEAKVTFLLFSLVVIVTDHIWLT